jgi:hypothetical protein
MKLEPSDQPTSLLPFHLNIEGKPGIRPKLNLITHQFLEPSGLGLKPGNVVVCLLEPAAICLFRQVMAKAAA